MFDRRPLQGHLKDWRGLIPRHVSITRTVDPSFTAPFFFILKNFFSQVIFFYLSRFPANAFVKAACKRKQDYLVPPHLFPIVFF